MNFDELASNYKEASKAESEARSAFTVQLRHLCDNLDKRKNQALSDYAARPNLDTHKVYETALYYQEMGVWKLEELRIKRDDAIKAVADINKTYGPIMSIRHNVKLLAKEGITAGHIIGLLE